MTKSEWNSQHWSQHAGLAYAGYQVKGRGALVLDVLPLVSPAPASPAANAESYLSLAELAAQDWLTGNTILQDILDKVTQYDPETQIVVVGRGLKGDIVIQVMGADDLEYSPKAVYERLERDLLKRRRTQK